MAKDFDELWKQIPAERRARIDERVESELLKIALRDLRKRRGLRQIDLARTLGVNQPALSKMEHQQDMNVSTLKRIIKGMGGQLRIVAEFPDGDVVINQFERKQK